METERVAREGLEVDNYSKSMTQAGLDLEIDDLINFMEELVKRQQGDESA